MSQEQGRIALVSDGARGIGAATVRKLAADGWDVSFCYREDALAARRVEKAASELGARVTAIQADICDPVEVSAWFDRTHDELGPVTAVVSCAGITRDQPLAMLTDQDWRAVTDAGLEGTFQLCRAATSAMLKRRTGRIVAVSSVCGAYDHCAQGHDISSRPGLAAFIRALADQTRRYGITVNAVVPGSATHDLTAIVPGPSRADVTETLDYVPGRFKVIRHVREAFSCRTCETMVQTPAPNHPIARGRAGSGLLAHIVVSKFDDHLPLYRQAEIYARDGVALETSTLSGWEAGGKAPNRRRSIFTRYWGPPTTPGRLQL